MKRLIFIVVWAVTTALRAEQAPLSRLEYTVSPGWERHIDPDEHVLVLMPPEGQVAVTFLASAPFSGTAAAWENKLWQDLATELEMKPSGETATGMEGAFRSRVGGFVKPDGTQPWAGVYSLVDQGRGEGIVYLAATKDLFVSHIGPVTRMVRLAKLASAVAPAPSTPPTPSPSSTVPQLSYREPADFYRGAGQSPVEFSSREVNCAVYVYPFRAVTGDPRLAFQQSLLREWIDPRFREGPLLAAPQIRPVPVPGATAALVAHFQENLGGQPNERLRFLILAGAQGAVVDVVANSAYSWQKASVAVQGMLASLQMTSAALPSSASAPVSTAWPVAGAPIGLFMGTKSKYVPNLNRGVGYGSHVPAPHYYLFSPEGWVHRCYDFPPGGPNADWRRFDFLAALRDDPANTGHYSVQGGRIVIETGGQAPETTTGVIRPNGGVEIDTIVYARQN